MTYQQAVTFLKAQDKSLRKVNGIKFEHNGFEYRLTYEGGFAAFIRIDRRAVGKRNFKYYSGFGGYNCLDCEDVLLAVRELMEKKGDW